MQESEDARIDYERKNQIWTLDDKQNITTQRLADVNSELTDAQSERMRKEALYRVCQGRGRLDVVPQLRDNPVVAGSDQKRAERRSGNIPRP